MSVPPPAAAPPRRRWPRRLGALLLVGLLLYGSACTLGMQPSVPFDVAINLGRFPRDPALAVDSADGRPPLVVLQHGLWRSPWALWKLERALVDHGYRVFNPSYPSTRATIEQHAERLHRGLQAEWARLGLAAGAGAELVFVGHSMGGLVIQEYLRRADALPTAACVYLGTPHRGAVLADLRKHWWVFRLFMGTAAAMQLSPGDPFHRQPIPLPGVAATVVGAVGDGEGRNRDIPGDDDGTVAEVEAHLPGESDSITLPVGHTGMTIDDRVIAQVLHFLKHRSFRRP